jgi:large subunit ribosomal protein L38e
MPAQVTDIKEFLEIARRKDAKGKLPSSTANRIARPQRCSNTGLVHTCDETCAPRQGAFGAFSSLKTIYYVKQRPDTDFTIAARIKRAPAATSGPKNNREQIKFKIRAKRHLHTLILNDSTKADKIKQSLPPGMFYPQEEHRDMEYRGNRKERKANRLDSSDRD